MRGSLILTDANSVVLYASDGAASRMGFDTPEIVGKKPGDVWGGFMPKTFYQGMWRQIRTGASFSSQVLNRKKDGAPSRDRLRIAPVLDENGEAKFFFQLEPNLDSAAEERRFSDEFERSVHAHASPEPFADFLQRWFRLDASFSTNTRAAFLHDLEAVFVRPTRERFGNRHEDRELVEQAKANSEAFHALYLKYLPQVERFFRYRVSSQTEAEDMAQDVFLRAFRALPAYAASNASYLTYLLRIAHNLLVSHYRGVKTFEPYTEDLREDWLGRFLRHDALERALENLSDLERSILLLKYREELSVREIALELRRSENAVKLHLSRARKKLKTSILNAKGVA